MPNTVPIRQHAERAVLDQAPEILVAGLVAHVGFIDEGCPVVIPMSYHYDPLAPDRLYLHGSQSSRALERMAGGAPVSICVTTTTGLVYSRTALYHSMNYQSVVCFGRGRVVTDGPEKDRLLRAMIGRYFAGRAAGVDYDVPPEEHLAGTTIVEIAIEGWSAKARAGGPQGPRDADPDAPGTCGVAEL
jgi:nitroimidazol reductase NimA-like FMN-containing flavoprotein (pyridoxamine 5'-phosphate oxidase superfamily)